MTEPDTPDTPEMPEMSSYVITVTRKFEVDFSGMQLQQLLQQAGDSTEPEAIEQAFLQQERQNIEPEQKLMGVDVSANEASDS